MATKLDKTLKRELEIKGKLHRLVLAGGDQDRPQGRPKGAGDLLADAPER